MKTYAAYCDNDIREQSSSGGLFSVIAEKFDVVYGVAMTSDCYGAEFIRVENDISPLRGSKYFQAKVGDTYKKVKQDLIDGKKVLFTGTGCQINGLSMYLGKQYDNLLLVDILCHGVPSRKLWKEYVKCQEKKYGKLQNVNFRSKYESWEKYGMLENDLYIPRKDDPYMKLFLWDFCLRPSCYECHARSLKKSDITIADFWGVDSVTAELNDHKGISLVIVRTDKGQCIFDNLKESLVWKAVNYQDAIKNNPVEYKSVEKPKYRTNFYSDLNNKGFEWTFNKYLKYMKDPLFVRLKHSIRSIVKK